MLLEAHLAELEAASSGSSGHTPSNGYATSQPVAPAAPLSTATDSDQQKKDLPIPSIPTNSSQASSAISSRTPSPAVEPAAAEEPETEEEDVAAPQEAAEADPAPAPSSSIEQRKAHTAEIEKALATCNDTLLGLSKTCNTFLIQPK
ncbi:MAG: hypothetical protein QG632_704 [Candidatus Dependentiae bacterium]|nr:hypothetical protein [Candidatus Dependentiae bacterium]